MPCLAHLNWVSSWLLGCDGESAESAHGRGRERGEKQSMVRHGEEIAHAAEQPSKVRGEGVRRTWGGHNRSDKGWTTGLGSVFCMCSTGQHRAASASTPTVSTAKSDI